jgi:aryl-alcohol dehydrogenase-like predicted oxidoreductase
VEKEIFLITKGAHPDPVTGKVSRFSKEEIHGDFYRSLEVMGLDRVDLYFLHRDDESLPVSGIMDALNELVSKGEAAAIGASNWRAERIKQANAWAVSQGKAPFTATQIQWSYADYAPACQDPTLVLMDETEMAAYEKMPDISVMAYTSQAEGIFSKGYLPDLSNVQPRHQRYVTEENIRRYQALLGRCSREAGMTPTRVMLEYIVRHPRLPGFALIGASNPDQLNDSMNAI